jgi:hypothetical protein
VVRPHAYALLFDQLDIATDAPYAQMLFKALADEDCLTYAHIAFAHDPAIETAVFDAITTGNFGGFDVWLDESADARLDIETNHGTIAEKLSDLRMNEFILEAGGLKRCMRVFCLPDHSLPRQYDTEVEVALKPKGDNPIWVCLTLEDGSQAWSSPIYLYNDE